MYEYAWIMYSEALYKKLPVRDAEESNANNV